MPDLNAPTPLDKLLMNENFKLIQDILDELQEYDMEKWGNVQVFELFPDILKDSEVLYEKCKVAELAKIAKVLGVLYSQIILQSSVHKSKECEHNM